MVKKGSGHWNIIRIQLFRRARCEARATTSRGADVKLNFFGYGPKKCDAIENDLLPTIPLEKASLSSTL